MFWPTGRIPWFLNPPPSPRGGEGTVIVLKCNGAVNVKPFFDNYVCILVTVFDVFVWRKSVAN